MTSNDDVSGANAILSRQLLLARLAEERANLLRLLRGIDEQTLNSSSVQDGWLVKNVLVHLGSWDAFHTERMSLVLNGRINAIHKLGGQEDIDSLNAEIITFSGYLTLEQALALCLKERSSLLAMLKRIPDDLLYQDIEMPWGWRTQMAEWTIWRYKHDAEHAVCLKAWRSQLEQEQKRQVGPIYLLRAILKTTRKEFLTLADLVPAHERTTRPVCGVWTLKDLVGHLTDWEQVGVAGLRQLVAGQTPEFNDTIIDFDSWNDEHAAARRDQPWDDVWHEFVETRSQLMALVEQMSDADWQRPFISPWDSPINTYFWVNVWAGHDHEHAADVRNALNL